MPKSFMAISQIGWNPNTERSEYEKRNEDDVQARM